MNCNANGASGLLRHLWRRLVRYTTLAVILLSSPLLAACDHVGLPERPSTAYAPEFEGMWDPPRRGSSLEEGGYLWEGTLAIEDSCVLVIEGGSQERIMVLLPRLTPRYRPAESRQPGADLRGPEYAIAWLPTLYDEDSQSLWVGNGERVTDGDRVSLGGFSSGAHIEKCDADWSFRADSIERWP